MEFVLDSAMQGHRETVAHGEFELMFSFISVPATSGLVALLIDNLID